jgi:hypothetical protein
VKEVIFKQYNLRSAKPILLVGVKYRIGL